MKTLRLLFASLTFSFLFLAQTNAQTITNITNCTYKVKANVVPNAQCTLAGVGPVYFVPGGAPPIIVPTLPSEWIPAYGVTRPMRPVRIPGEPNCLFNNSYYVGKCMGVNTFATYAAENLTIHY